MLNPQRQCRGVSVATSLGPYLLFLCLFNFSHSSACGQYIILVLICISLLTKGVAHLFMWFWLLFLFFGKVSVQILYTLWEVCHVLNLVILSTHLLLEMCFTFSSPSLWFGLIFLTASFKEQRLILIKSHLSSFSVLCFCVLSKNSLPNKKYKYFFLCFTLIFPTFISYS